MVLILYQSGCSKVAQQAAGDIRSAFRGHVEVVLRGAHARSPWPQDPSWDDLLVVFFDGTRFPASGNTFIAGYLHHRSNGALLLPVATNPSATKPPAPAAAIKALLHDRTALGPCGRLANRVGSMLGLRLQSRDGSIFISYRSSDGAAIANQVDVHFKQLGYRSFLDEAKELDNEPTIRPGSPVQKEIDEALGRANLVLLIDTPDAPGSAWIKHEVETADSLLLPILPLCFHIKADKRIGPRFPSLAALQRWVRLEIPSPAAKRPLKTEQLETIVREAETYLSEIFRRRCRVPFLVEKEFLSHGFAWKVLDQKLLMFESSKKLDWRVPTTVVSHCSIFDQVYGPALQRFSQFLGGVDRCNYSLFIYDGELLPDPILKDIVVAHPEAIILHHQELAALIDSRFTTVITS